MSSVFFLLYFASTSNMLLLSHAADSSSSGDDTTGGGGGPPPLPPSNDKHTVHLMEVWTNNAADAYTIAPMLLRTSTYNNVLRVRCYPTQNSAHTAHLDQHSQNLADIDLRTFDSSCGSSSSDGDDEQSTTEPIRSKPQLHVSNKYVVRNEDGTVNQQQFILAIAQVSNVKCELLKAACEKTRHWLPCFTYNIFCKGKTNSPPPLPKVVSRHRPEAVNLQTQNLFCSHQRDY
eukprot:gene13350-14727_t